MQLDSPDSITAAQMDSSKRLLVHDAHVWWQALFPEDKVKPPRKSKGKGKGKGKGKKKKKAP